MRGLKGNILIYALINCGVKANIITPSLLVCSGLNYDGQRLKGYKYQGYYCGHLRKPSGQPSDTPWMVVSHIPEARACSI